MEIKENFTQISI